MIAIFTKELRDFFSSLTGYISAIVFLLIIGLVMWVVPGDLNVLDSGYATLDPLFSIAPWVFLFLVPAVTMRTFSDEKRSGTIELILTRPISDTQMVLGKFFASVVLVLIILIPALLFYLSVYLLGNPVGNIDTGGTWGSFIGLFFLASAYAAVGIFTSSLTDNSIVSFILSMLLCFLLYAGLEALALLDVFEGIRYFLVSLSIGEHYSSMSRGVIDTRDVVYFVALAALFIVFTRTKLEARKW